MERLDFVNGLDYVLNIHGASPCHRKVDAAGGGSAPALIKLKGRKMKMKINRKAQIARVIAAQGLSVSEASEQVSGRVYEALKYLKRREQRNVAAE